MKWLWSIVLFLGLVALVSGAQEYIPLGGVEGQEIDVRVLESSGTRTVVELRVPGIEV